MLKYTKFILVLLLGGPFLSAQIPVGTVAPQTYTFVVTDTNGLSDLEDVYILFAKIAPPNNTPYGVTPSGCLLEYVKSSNALYLTNDSGIGQTGPVTVGSASTLSNSQCSVNGANVAVTSLGNSLTFVITYQFTATFSGAHQASLQTVQATPFMGGHNFSGWFMGGTQVVPQSQQATSASKNKNNGSSGGSGTILQQWNSVIAYGALGNGITDDTQAINNAIASTPLCQEVWFPNGTYDFSSLTFSQCVTLVISGNLAPTANISFPSYVTLNYIGGQIVTSSGHTTTILGPQIAGATQIYTGTGTIAGLTEVRPEWFGGTVLNSTVVNSLSSSGGVVDLPNTYQSSFTSFTTPGTTCINTNGVWLRGNQQPKVDNNTTPTQLVDGSIVQGGVYFCGAYNAKVTDLGFDVGSAYAGTSTADALDINGTSGGSNLADPIVDSPYVQNVTALLSSNAVAFHGILIEHANNVRAFGLDAWLGVHGIVFKSTKVQAAHLRSHGQGSDGLDFKTDLYTTTGNLDVDDYYGESLSSSAALNNCVALDAEANVGLDNVTLSNFNCQNSIVGLNFLTNSTTTQNGYITQVQVSNFNYQFNQSGLGFTVGTCIQSTGTGTNTLTAIQLKGTTCAGNTGAGNMFPMTINVPLNFSNIEGMKTSSSSPSQISGSNLSIRGWNSSNTTSDHALHFINDSIAYLSDFVYVEPNPPVVDAGSALYEVSMNPSGNLITTGGFVPAGIIFGEPGGFVTIRAGSGAAYDLDVQNAAGSINTFLLDDSGSGIFQGVVTAKTGFALPGSVMFTSGSGAPGGSCVVGSQYYNYTASTASTSRYSCYPANTWTAVGP